MKEYTTTFHVDVPPAVAFAFLKDPTTAMPGMSEMELIHGSPDEVGSVWRYEERFLGMGFTGLFVVVEYVENERIKGEFSGGLEEGAGIWTFEGAGGGTDVTVESSFRVRLPLVGGLAAGLMMRASQSRWVPALKEAMEEYATEAHAAEAAG
jgi:carbon monoxide dehydrogenase subunit G